MRPPPPTSLIDYEIGNISALLLDNDITDRPFGYTLHCGLNDQQADKQNELIDLLPDQKALNSLFSRVKKTTWWQATASQPIRVSWGSHGWNSKQMHYQRLCKNKKNSLQILSFLATALTVLLLNHKHCLGSTHMNGVNKNAQEMADKMPPYLSG